jgi:hypothetical protein
MTAHPLPFLVVLTSLMAAVPQATATSPRFQLRDAAATPRFTVAASTARFTLAGTACSLVDALFANGFETTGAETAQ